MSANETQVGGSHYKERPVQAWDFIHRNGIGFLAGNVIKYLVRHREKGGVVDLKKAKHYLEKLIEEEELAATVQPTPSDDVCSCGLRRIGGKCPFVIEYEKSRG